MDGDESDHTLSVNSDGTHEESSKKTKKHRNKRKKSKMEDDSSDTNIEQIGKKLMTVINEQKTIIERQQIEIEKLQLQVQMMLNNHPMEYLSEEEVFTDNEEGAEETSTKSRNDEFPELPTPSVKKGNVMQSASINAAGKKPRPLQVQLPPPITVYNVDTKIVIEKTKQALKNNNFNINIINKNITKIMPQQSADHENIVKSFKNDNIKFFTYTPKDKKPFSLIIKKLPLCFEVSDVTEAIGGLNMKVFKTNHNWIIQLKNTSDIRGIKSIKYLLHCRVQIESVKRNRLLQCKNCQRFNHAASNCNMPYRCVKCCESHEPGDCKIPKKELSNETVVITDKKTGEKKNIIGIPVQCVNCGKEGHTANASTCEVRRRILMKNHVAKQQQDVSSQSIRKENISYASLLNKPKVNRELASNDKDDFFEIINKECSGIFGKNLLTCILKVGEFKEQYCSLKNKDDKAKALFNLFLSLQIDD